MNIRQVVISSAVNDNFSGAGTNYLVETPSRVLYAIYVDPFSDVIFRKSTDGGITWTNTTSIHAGTVIALAVWYDRWSGISAGKIHCAYTDNGVDDILYRSIDTENSDALSGATTVFLGSTAIAGGALSITRARGGNLVVAGSIDAGTEDGAWESTDAGATWASAMADPSEGGTTDQYHLLPGWNADTQDVMLIFWDASAEELSVKRYDDSANSWAETSIATTMVDTPASTSFPHFAVAVDLTNSRNVLVAWSAVDLANADLRCWTITDTAITEVTNVVLNSADDQGFCAISINNGQWTVFYAGKSNGTEVLPSAVNIYQKTSADSGSTWGAETLLSPLTRSITWMVTAPRSVRNTPPVMTLDGATPVMIRVAMDASLPRASYQAGVM
ncbi:MAG: hypothetical protein A2W28_09700 [Gammaproteobacteria bacterium RBG_16_51_14]|nr:MAG: hypothetical protein A2W28_09700 [Gammaproteobacteria bacterium RBG_16_51_14]